jgi:hypothetical protein
VRINVHSNDRRAQSIRGQLRPRPTPSKGLDMTAALQTDRAAQTLDGRSFHGVVLEAGHTAGDADTLIFDGGRFRSTACDRYGYGDGAYRASRDADGISFTAETESAQYGRLRWHGTVRGARLDGTLQMVRDGAVIVEKWVLAGER